ncbi:MAG: UDP-N-acetylglucosamine 1-carboxyvinyltransferase [Oscillospiraceae bacterium]|nr:UDP-N-acetylglucosamine 1-carboxyvinyltransferase [Oscillospiraceae bacterium]
MEAYVIQGGRPLNGFVRVHGAKNSVLPILAATILSGKESLIYNCPHLKDVDSSFRILRHLGCVVRRQDEAVYIDSGPIAHHDVPDSLMREMRSSVVFLGAILGRQGKAVMSFPGGCELGPRPIDLHLWALRKLGADIRESGGNLYCETNGLKGAEISLSLPSVGATENIMLAASAAKGVTRIQNAACEPEIEDLQNFINAMGGSIHGAGTPTVVVEGAREFRRAEHSIIPDRIVAATYMACAAIAGGDVTLTGVNPAHLRTVTAALSDAGCEIDVTEDSLRIARSDALKSMRQIRTMPYPGFPTDAQSPIMAVAARAEGTTLFVENIFESRYRHVGELTRMGADIKVEGRIAVVSGVKKLYGAHVKATDLRGGAALVVAGIGAEGETVVTELDHIDRGYESMHVALSALGANMTRKTV